MSREAEIAEGIRKATEQMRAIEYFAETWRELILDLPDNYDCHMNCTEVNAVADFYRALGDEAAAKAILNAHAQYDEEGDQHYTGRTKGAIL